MFTIDKKGSNQAVKDNRIKIYTVNWQIMINKIRKKFKIMIIKMKSINDTN